MPENTKSNLKPPLSLKLHVGSLENGKWQPKYLSQKHKNIIALHAQAMRRDDIAKYCGCTPEYVSTIVATPIAQKYLKDLENYMDSRLRQLQGRVVDVIEDGLDGNATDNQLKAARLQMEATGKLKGDKSSEQTAEDIVSRLLDAASGGVVAIGQNVQVNVGDKDGGN